jgi:hypothetical protein
MNFTFRALEISGSRMWERKAILQALDFIERHRMTDLVLHETDGLQKILYPRVYFDPYAKWKSAPARRGENAILNNRVYFDHLLNLTGQRGIGMWLEMKQLGFPDEVLEMRPDLMKNGNVCPCEPFWYEFLEASVDELYRDFPKLSGLIVSAGSPEGRASRAQNKCGCDLCQATSVEDWYYELIMAMHRASAKHGKPLAVRDFAYKPADHEPLIAAMRRTPPEVIFCIKATPHDFYPTFPHNTAIGRLRDRVQWIEYDTMGQFYGLAIAPCYVGADMADRLRHGEENGITGGLFRTDWERINDWWSLETINEVNLIAAARMSNGEPADTETVTRIWLTDHGYPEAAAPWLAGVLDRTWPIIRRALYVDDFMMADSSFFPRGVAKAWWTMELKHSLSAWDPSRAEDLKLSPGRMKELLAEKDQAMQMVTALAETIRAGAPGLPADLHALLIDRAGLFVTYVEGFVKAARVCLWSRALAEGVAGAAPALAAAVDELQLYQDRIQALSDAAEYPHQVIQLIDFKRIADVVREGREVLAGRLESAL